MKNKKFYLYLAFSFVIFFTFVLAPTVAAGKGFPQKTITWIVTYPPGGGFDTYARAIAKHMPKYLPRKVQIVIKNSPGAGGRYGTNLLYRARPNGHTIGILNVPGVLISQMVMKTKYDMTQFAYIGACDQVKYCLSVPKNSPFKSLKDLQQAKKPVRMSTTGKGSSGGLMSIMTAEFTKIPYTMVTGYKGAPASMVAAIRGDVDAVMDGGIESQLTYITEGELIPLFVLGSKKEKYLPDVITIKELGYPELAPLGMYRLIAAPPGTPKDIVTILEKALLKTLDDTDFRAWSKKAKRSIHPSNGKEARDILKAQAKLYEQYRELLKKAVKK